MKMTMGFERYLTQSDAAILSRLAQSLLHEIDFKFDTGADLMELLSTAILLPENAQRDDCVTLDSEVSYMRMDMPERQSITLVCPHDANHSLARISILAPLAMALIGRRINSVVDVALPGGHSYAVKVVNIKRPGYRNSVPALEHTEE